MIYIPQNTIIIIMRWCTYIYKKTMYTLSSLLHTYKNTTTQHMTRRSSGVAPQACVRVYARVLGPPNLYIHTCPYIRHTTHTCTQAQLKHTTTHTHTHTHNLTLHHQRICSTWETTDVCQHQYRKRCAPTRRDALHNLLIYVCLLVVYVLCLAWGLLCHFNSGSPRSQGAQIRAGAGANER